VVTAVAASAAYLALLPAREERFRFRNSRGDEFERLRLLTDGGVYTTLGLSMLALDRNDRSTPTSTTWST